MEGREAETYVPTIGSGPVQACGDASEGGVRRRGSKLLGLEERMGEMKGRQSSRQRLI